MPTSVIEYNAFEFPYTQLSVSEETVYAEDNITQIGTQYEFSVSGWLTANDHAEMQANIWEMRCKLRERGKSLRIGWGPDNDPGATAFWTFDGGTDTNDYGPHPGQLTIDRFSGGLAAAYQWSIRTFAKECFSEACVLTGAPSSTPILSVTRSWQHSVDASGLCVRTCSGVLRIKGSLTTGRTADDYRDRCVPSLPTNYRRVSQNFSVSPNGLELQFSVTDQEMVYTLPQPITDGEASFMVRITDMGLMAQMQLSGYFEAPPDTPKATIIAKIGNLAAAYFPLSTPGLVFESRELRSEIYGRNRVDFSIAATAAAGSAVSSTPNFTIGLNELMQSPPESNGNALPVGGYGLSTTAIRAPVPTLDYDACTGSNPTTPTTPTGSSETPVSSGGSPYPTQSPGTASNSDVSVEHQAAPWVAYHERISYEFDNGIVYFTPKETGVPPMRQQARIPTVKVIQAGYAVKFGKALDDRPKAPTPMYTDTPGFTVLNASVDGSNPEPVGDGSWNRFTIHWRYIMQVDRAFTEGPVEMEPKFPADPRRESLKNGGGSIVITEKLMVIPS